MARLTWFALKALFDLETMNADNARAGTSPVDVGGAKRSGL
jgi:hypothetical protein